jgi:hypothetical protein
MEMRIECNTTAIGKWGATVVGCCGGTWTWCHCAGATWYGATVVEPQPQLLGLLELDVVAYEDLIAQ